MTSHVYYTVKPLLPRWLQIWLRRQRVRYQRNRNGHRWPIWDVAGDAPPEWPGWPGGKRFAFVPTHDVELDYGVSRCEQLADLEEERGIRSEFAFVPMRYQTPERLRHSLTSRGFEISVHGLYHDGKLFRNRQIFAERRDRINDILAAWETRGFTSPSAHHNLEWISELDIDYDVSTYDMDPFEPQPCAIGRIFPFCFNPSQHDRSAFVELPYTLVQDFTVYILMGEKNNSIWKAKLDWIAEKGGMALIKTHPDYMSFSAGDQRMDRYPAEFYTDFLDYVLSRYGDEVWIAQPSEVARYWRSLPAAVQESERMIVPRETFCTSCRDAHSAGRLTHYSH